MSDECFHATHRSSHLRSSRLRPDDPARDEILARHAAAIAAGDDGYIDPVSGYFVFTATRLAANGACCSSGCRHCPFGA